MSAHREVQAIVERYSLRAKKRLGQNFLVDGTALDDIARTAAAAGADGPPGFIEIGPGPGTLTRRLASRHRPVVAIEKDAVLVHVLNEELGSLENFRVIQGDALKLDLAEQLPEVDRPAVVGNVPYNISSALLVRLVEQRDRLGPVTLLLQREVVDRLLAEPGSKTYGRLSVLLQLYAEPKRGRLVPAGAFWPAPKVQSAVVSWRWRTSPAVPVRDGAHFTAVVKAAFSQRRKMLRNALRSAFSSERVDAAARAGFDVGQRAERLTLADFSRLADLLQAPDV